MDGAIIFITGWYPSTQDIYDSDVGSVNVQYQMSDFLVILSIDIFDHNSSYFTSKTLILGMRIPLGRCYLLFGTIKISESYELPPIVNASQVKLNVCVSKVLLGKIYSLVPRNVPVPYETINISVMSGKA